MGIIIVVMQSRRTDKSGSPAPRWCIRVIRAMHIPVNIGNKGRAAAIPNGLHHLAHKDRVERGITNIASRVDLYGYRFALYPLADIQLFDDEVQLRGQRFIRLQLRLPGRPIINGTCHVFSSITLIYFMSGWISAFR